MCRRFLLVVVSALGALLVLVGASDRGAGHEIIGLVPTADVAYPATPGSPGPAGSATVAGGLSAPICPAEHDRVVDSLSATSVTRGADAEDPELAQLVVTPVPVPRSDPRPDAASRSGDAGRTAAVDRVSLCVDRS